MIRYSNALSVLGVGLLVRLLYVYLRKKRKPDEDVIKEVLFFPDKEYPCPLVVKTLSSRNVDLTKSCRNPSCRKLHGRSDEASSSMIKFLKHLASAKHQIDLCIYIFTQNFMANILKDLHKANVKIRIITDSADDEVSASQLERLSQLGVEIKSNRRMTGALMHHKFVVIDEKILLAGSFNWTNKAVVSNYESVLVTSDTELVGPFVEKFNEMWLEFPRSERFKRI